MVQQGRDIIITTDIGGTQMPVGAAKSGTFTIRQDFIESCPPNDGRTTDKIPTRYDWSMSCDCLVYNPQCPLSYIEALKAGTKFSIQFIAGGFKQSGYAFVESAEYAGSVGSLSAFRVSFKGSGPLTTNDGGWDFINGTLYTYSNFADGTLNMGGYLTDGTLQHDEPSES